MARSVTCVAKRPAFSFAIDPSAFLNLRCLPSQAARQVSIRVASISVAISANINAID